jgi:hypothetical protein
MSVTWADIVNAQTVLHQFAVSLPDDLADVKT